MHVCMVSTLAINIVSTLFSIQSRFGLVESRSITERAMTW